eukprot:TRINITY_DN2094_c0_g1_i1.p1 TRINITY_DN2094_c0_g1~~TRINITY_DN2094_c0_g1_i1.p1  ORF type:complete len:355 (+),score=54.92 TRINITY_DN2094_c0_g1_i1:105-1169(+)
MVSTPCFCLAFGVLLFLVAEAAGASDELVLKQVQVLSRHGDRTPTTAIKTSPVEWTCSENQLQHVGFGTDATVLLPDRLHRVIADANHMVLEGNCFAGQLTTIGFDEVAALGAWLQQAYVVNTPLIDGSYNADQVYVRSSNVPRTIQSAQGILAGLFPQMKPTSDSAVVVPIIVRDSGTEDMHLNPSYCPRMVEAASEALLLDPAVVAQITVMLDPIRKILEDAFNSTDPLLALEYYDNMNCRAHHNLSQPAGITPEVLQVLTDVWGLLGGVLFNSTTFSMGSFWTTLLNNLQHPEQTVKLFLFSGHDTSVGPLLSALQLYNGTWPPYASNIVLELWQNSSGLCDAFFFSCVCV